MSDGTEVSADTGAPVEGAVDTQIDTTVDQGAVDAGNTPEVNEAPAEPKYEVPKKYLNEDGTPNYEKLTKAFHHLEKKLGSKPNIPAADVSEYEFNFGEGFDLNEERAVAFKEACLAKGFTKDQYNLVMDTYAQMLNETTWTYEKTESNLKEAWGNDFQANTKAAQRAFAEFAPSDVNPHDPVWNHPGVMKLLARMGAEIGEDSAAAKPLSSGTSESIQEQITALRNDPDYWSNPQKQALMEKLYSKLK